MKTAPLQRNAKRKNSGHSGKYAAVLNVYMEEAPLVSDWRTLTETPNVVVVTIFISTDYTATKTFRGCWELQDGRPERAERSRRTRWAAGRSSRAPRLRLGDGERTSGLSGRIRTRSTVARCFTLHPSVPTQALLTSLSSRRTRPQKVEIVLALGFLCATLFFRE